MLDAVLPAAIAQCRERPDQQDLAGGEPGPEHGLWLAQHQPLEPQRDGSPGHEQAHGVEACAIAARQQRVGRPEQGGGKTHAIGQRVAQHMAPHDRQAEAVAAQHARQTPQADQHAWPQPPASRLLAAQHGQHDGEAGPEIVDEPDFHGLAAVVGQAHGHGQADFIDHEQQAAAPEIGRCMLRQRASSRQPLRPRAAAMQMAAMV
jgi:hypothetical protein